MLVPVTPIPYLPKTLFFPLLGPYEAVPDYWEFFGQVRCTSSPDLYLAASEQFNELL
jgi:hypothetical protein